MRQHLRTYEYRYPTVPVRYGTVRYSKNHLTSGLCSLSSSFVTVIVSLLFHAGFLCGPQDVQVFSHPCPRFHSYKGKLLSCRLLRSNCTSSQLLCISLRVYGIPVPTGTSTVHNSKANGGGCGGDDAQCCPLAAARRACVASVPSWVFPLFLILQKTFYLTND